MSQIPEHLFHLPYSSKCTICSDDSIRGDVNHLLYDKYRDKTIDGKNITFKYIKEYIEQKYDTTLPSVPSIKRHYTNHFVYYLENQMEIPEALIIEYNKTKKVKKTLNSDNERKREIEKRYLAIEDSEMKLYDVFPLTGLNTQTGINSITGEYDEKSVLTWEEWCKKYLKLSINNITVPMEVPIHAGDLLRAIDKYPGILLLIARGHLKSTILQIYTIRNLCDFQKRFLYIGGSNQEVKRYTENIRTQLKENDDILLDYGYLPHPKHGDSSESLTLRMDPPPTEKDPHLTYATPPRAGGGTSRLGGHSDVIILDDIQDENSGKSEKIRAKHEDWFDRNILPMRKGNTKLIVAGTRKDFDDIYAYIKKKKYLLTLESPAIIKFPNGEKYERKTRRDGVEVWEGGQQESIPDDPDKWHYVFDTTKELIGTTLIEQEIISGVENLIGGEVFWDEFKKDAWESRRIKYYNTDGTFDKQKMAMQEVLIDKFILEADPEKGHFSFWSEYQLDPVEMHGRHFEMDKIKYYDRDMFDRIVKCEGVPKFTWIDVGYSSPHDGDQKTKDTKKGKTVFCTAALVSPGKDGQEEFKPNEAGMYVLEVKTGDYFITHEDPGKSLLYQLIKVNDTYSPQSICFEDNFFGKYVRYNSEIVSSDYGLPLIGKKNTLDKKVRISNGINARLNNKKSCLWMCEETEGFDALLRQIQEFPNCSKFDEIDALESCDRLLVRRSAQMVLLGNGSDIFNLEHKGLGPGVRNLGQASLNPFAGYRYYGITRRRY